MSEQQIGRVAFRVEGKWWNAYYAMPGTMKGAIKLASIRMTLVEKEERRTAFLKTVELCVGDAMGTIIGTRPSWKKPVPAPEHERKKP